MALALRWGSIYNNLVQCFLLKCDICSYGYNLLTLINTNCFTTPINIFFSSVFGLLTYFDPMLHYAENVDSNLEMALFRAAVSP